MALPLRRRISVRGVLGRRRDEDEEEEKTTPVAVANVPRFSHHVEKNKVPVASEVGSGEVDVSDLKRRLAAKKSSPKVSVEEIEEVYEETEEPKVVAKSSKKTSDEEEEEEEEEYAFGGFAKTPNGNYLTLDEGPVIEHEKAVLRKKGTNPMVDILEHMKIGTILVIIKEDKESWKVTQTDKFFTSLITPAMAGARLKGKSFWDAVSNPEYQQWSREWNQLTFSEKKKRAEKMGVTWEISKNPKIEAMNITKAVREHLGIEKYRDEYKSRASRANIKGH